MRDRKREWLDTVKITCESLYLIFTSVKFSTQNIRVGEKEIKKLDENTKSTLFVALISQETDSLDLNKE